MPNLTCPLLPSTLIRVKLTQEGRASLPPIVATSYDRPVTLAQILTDFGGGEEFPARCFRELQLVLPESTEFTEDKPAMTLGTLLQPSAK